MEPHPLLVTIQFDGGCGPTNPGHKYGSYSIKCAGKTLHLASRIQLGFGTNNEAEFETLIAALEYTLNRMAVSGKNPKLFPVLMLTDSTIVANRVSGRNNRHKGEAQQRMHKLALRCRELLEAFHSYEIRWQRRDFNVAEFGH